jgi:Protein of unknown function (DUF2800)
MTTVIDKGHSRFGGSSASRWMNCAGSVALLDTVPAKPDGPYAAEGTAAHFVAEQCLKENLPAAHFLDYLYTRSGVHITVTEDMAKAVQVYLDEVNREVTATRDAELRVEQGFELDIATADPGEVFGTNDAMVYHPETGRLRIFDYKHGVGVSVSAEENAQLKFYAAGAVFSRPEWRIAEVILTIVQPRARDNESPEDAVRDWSFTVPDLLDFLGEVETAIGRARAPTFRESSFKTGAWCRWCDAAAVCPAKEAEALAAATLDYADVTLVAASSLPQPKELDVERLSAVVAGIGIISAWQAQCQEYLEGLVLSGVEVPGWKAVEKIGRAKWIEDPQKVASYMEMMFGIEAAQIMPPKLVTITEAEKLMKAAGASKDDIDTFKLAHTIKESSGLTLAPASDRRPSVNAAAENFGAAKLGN